MRACLKGLVESRGGWVGGPVDAIVREGRAWIE